MANTSDLNCELNQLSAKLRKSVKLEHLFALIDDNALLQHAKFSVPAKKEGYTIDDNARALVFLSKVNGVMSRSKITELQRRLMSFMLLMQEEDGRFHNLMDFSRRITDEASVGDHLGRAIWAAGVLINSSAPPGIVASARLMFDRALPWARSSSWLRTQAYTCLGIHERLNAEPEDHNLRNDLKTISDNLISLYHENRVQNWDWFEGILSYDNSRLSQALLAAYQSLGDVDYLKVGEATLQFLIDVEMIDETYVPIGNEGWYVRGQTRAIYDQQAIEAGAIVEAAVMARKLSRSSCYERILRKALGWFLGLNTKKAVVYDRTTGACFDGITPEGLNQNQGAESTLAFLLAFQSLSSAGSF